jgi:hypothetical protein
MPQQRHPESLVRRPSGASPPARARRILDDQVAEIDLQRAVIQAAEALGWQVMHIRDARGQIAAGWPDLTLVKPPRIILAELKRERRYPTPIQRSWLALLDACPGVEVFRWYPRHWSSGEIERVLRES